MPAKKTSAAKNAVFTVVALVLFLALFFGFGEFMFRVTRGAPNPLAETTQNKKEYLFEPGKAKVGTSGQHDEFEYTANINRFGYRGGDFAVPKPTGTLRILAVGDSFTFGVGAQDNETIPAVLENDLQKINPNIDVINAGIGHGSPISHLVNLKNIHLQYQPDVVLLLLDMTDIQDDWRLERMAVYDETGAITHFDPMFVNGKRDLWRTLVYYSAFAKVFEQKVLRSWEKLQLLGLKTYMETKRNGERAKAVIVNSAEGTYADEVILDFDGLLMLRGKERERLIRQQFERSAGYIVQIRDLLQERGIPLILIMYPHGIYVGADEWSQGRLTWGFDPDKRYDDYFAFELVADFAKKNAIPFINTLEAFVQAPPGNYFYEWDGHMTPQGYALVAHTIAGEPWFKTSIQVGVKQ